MPLPKIPARTTPGFSFSIVERSLRECIAIRKFGRVEAEAVAAFFKYECAFCGGPIQRWDHLISISSGGDTVLGNMVPACSRCDDSKQGNPFEEWANGPAPASPKSRAVPNLKKRLNRIQEYIKLYNYHPVAPSDRLMPDEQEKYDVIRQDLARARRDFDDFLKIYRNRTGQK